jgi:hypothetical protein
MRNPFKKKEPIDPIISGDGFPPDFVPPVVPNIRFGNTEEVLHRYDVVLLAHPCCDACVAFTNEEVEHEKPLLFRVPMDMFIDMGSPIQITLSLVPGDNLTEEA